MNYDIVATKEGYASDTVSIIVINVPKLTIVLSVREVDIEKTFEVTVADDTGKAVIGAIVTFSGDTYTTGAQGTVILTAPKNAGNYSISASFEGYKNADAVSITVLKDEDKTPGFGIFVFIVSLGIALIVLKRKRK